MIVCHCRGISERRILEVIRDGCSTVCSVAEACGAGTSCGGCVPLVREIVETELETRETLGVPEHGTLRRAS